VASCESFITKHHKAEHKPRVNFWFHCAVDRKAIHWLPSFTVVRGNEGLNEKEFLIEATFNLFSALTKECRYNALQQTRRKYRKSSCYDRDALLECRSLMKTILNGTWLIYQFFNPLIGSGFAVKPLAFYSFISISTVFITRNQLQRSICSK
jgi:hypothetical protein